MEMCDCSREDAEKAMKMAGGNEDEAANIIFDGRLHDDEIAQVAHEAIHGGAREDLRRRRRAAERFPQSGFAARRKRDRRRRCYSVKCGRGRAY